MKAVQHGIVRDAELETRRWGPGGREAFGNPRPGDYPGQAAPPKPKPKRRQDMTTMRSVEPLTGIDAIAARIFPFLTGTEPRPGERGIDRHGGLYVRTPEGTWRLIRPPQPELEAGA